MSRISNWGELIGLIKVQAPGYFSEREAVILDSAVEQDQVESILLSEPDLRGKLEKALQLPGVAQSVATICVELTNVLAGIKRQQHQRIPLTAEDRKKIEADLKNLGTQYLAERRGTALDVARSRLTAEGLFSWRQEAVTLAMSKDRELQHRVVALTTFMADEHTSSEIMAKVRETFPQAMSSLPAELNAGIRIAHAVGMLPAFARAPIEKMLAQTITALVDKMAGRFIAGENAEQAWRTAAATYAHGGQPIFDILGESVASEEDAETFVRKYLEIINYPQSSQGHAEKMALSVEDIKEITRARRGVDSLVKKFDGQHDVDFQIAIKFSMFSTLWNENKNPHATAREVKVRFRTILDAVLIKQAQTGLRIGITVDAEHYRYNDFMYQVFMEIMDEPKYRQMQNVGIVVQAYLRDSARTISRLASWSRKRGGSIPIRLVKGAYHPQEFADAEREGRPSPVFYDPKNPDSSWMSDYNYERMIDHLVDNSDALRLQHASHNPRAHFYAIARSRFAQTPSQAQMLNGIEDRGKAAFDAMGMPYAVYMPVGEKKPGMPYLTRRFAETTKPGSILERLAAGTESDEAFLQSPLTGHNVTDYLNSVSDFMAWKNQQPDVGSFTHEEQPPFTMVGDDGVGYVAAGPAVDAVAGGMALGTGVLPGVRR